MLSDLCLKMPSFVLLMSTAIKVSAKPTVSFGVKISPYKITDDAAPKTRLKRHHNGGLGRRRVILPKHLLKYCICPLKTMRLERVRQK